MAASEDLVARVEGIIAEMEQEISTDLEVVRSARLGPPAHGAVRAVGDRLADIDQRQRICSEVQEELGRLRHAAISQSPPPAGPLERGASPAEAAGQIGQIGTAQDRQEPCAGGLLPSSSQLQEIRRMAENCQRSEQQAWTAQEAAQTRAERFMVQLQSMEARYYQAKSAAEHNRLACSELQGALKQEQASAKEALAAHGAAEANLRALEEHSGTVLADCRELQSLLGAERTECRGLRKQVSRMTEMLSRHSDPDGRRASPSPVRHSQVNDEVGEECAASCLKEDISQLDAVISDVVRELEERLREEDASEERWPHSAKAAAEKMRRRAAELEEELRQARDGAEAQRELRQGLQRELAQAVERSTELEEELDRVRGLRDDHRGAVRQDVHQELVQARSMAQMRAAELEAERRRHAEEVGELRRRLRRSEARGAELERLLADSRADRGGLPEHSDRVPSRDRSSPRGASPHQRSPHAASPRQASPHPASTLELLPDGAGDARTAAARSAAVPHEECERLLEEIHRNGWKSKEWKGGYSMLHWAATEGSLDLCRHLLQLRADPLAQDDFGRSPRKCAEDAGNASVAAFLSGLMVDDGVPPELEQVVQRIDQYGWDNVGWAKGFTALHMAAKEDSAALCARFLAAGADLWAQDDTGRTAMDYAHEFGSHGALAELEEWAAAAPRSAARHS